MTTASAIDWYLDYRAADGDVTVYRHPDRLVWLVRERTGTRETWLATQAGRRSPAYRTRAEAERWVETGGRRWQGTARRSARTG